MQKASDSQRLSEDEITRGTTSVYCFRSSNLINALTGVPENAYLRVSRHSGSKMYFTGTLHPFAPKQGLSAAKAILLLLLFSAIGAMITYFFCFVKSGVGFLFCRERLFRVLTPAPEKFLWILRPLPVFFLGNNAGRVYSFLCRQAL